MSCTSIELLPKQVEQTEESHPLNSPLLQRALLLFSQHRYDLAETELRRILTEEPQHAEALSLLGMCLAKQQKFAEAEEATQTAVGLAPDSGMAHYAHAWVLHDRNKFPQAEQAIEQALQYDPFSPPFLGLLAQIRVSRKNWQGALDAAEKGLMLDPENVDCNNLRAIALVNLGRQSEAAATLQTNLQKDPDDPVTHTNLGWTCLHQGDSKKAIVHFKEALRLDASSEWAQAGLIEAMKARFWPYRLLLQFFLWFSRFSNRAKVLILLGAFFGNQILLRLAKEFPNLDPLITPISIAYLVVVLATWFGVPLANLALMVHPLGRMALKPADKRLALLVGLCVIGIGIGFIGYYVTDDFWYAFVSSAFLYILFPLMSWHAAPKDYVGKVMLAYLLGLVAIAVVFLTQFAIDPRITLLNWWDIFRWGCMLSTFIVQFFPFRSIVR